MTDYSLWEIILNGDSPVPTEIVKGILQPVAPTTAEQKLDRKNKLKAYGTLLMALPEKHQLKFNSHKDSKTLMEAIEKRFGGNTQTKKVEKTLLKQHYKNFTGSHLESLDQIHDRLQKLVSQLEIHEVSLSQEDVNLKFLRSTATQNLDFVSSSNTDSTTESVSVAASVSAVCPKIHVSSLPNVDSLSNAVIYSFFSSQSTSPQLDNEDLKQIDVDDLKEMDIRWQMAMLTMRAKRFLQKIGRNLGANGPTSIGFDMSKVECYNCHRKGHFARECRSLKDSRRNDVAEPQRRTVPVFTHAMFDCDDYLSPESDCESWPPSSLYDRFQPSGGYHVVFPPYTRTFMPPKPDLVFNTAPTTVETNHPAFNVFDSEDESKTKALQIVLSFVQSSKQVKSPRHFVQPVETSIPAATLKPASPKSNSSGKRRNRKACFVCKSVDHLIKDCDYHAKKMAQSSPRNYAHRVSAVVPKLEVTRPRLAHPIITKSKSPIKRYITHSPSLKTSNSPPRVTAVQALVVSVAQGNMSYLSDFEELNGRYVAFRGNPKGGKIFGKGKIKTGKVDEGFLVGYSVNSKAFRVFNSRTRIVQETLHVNFLENKPIVAGSGPTWLFDIDSLTRTMNYLVTAGNQTNPSVGFQDKFDAEKAGEEINQQCVLFPMWSSGSTNPQNYDGDAAFEGKEHDFDAKRLESEVILSPSRYRDLSVVFEDCSDNSSNEINAAGTIVPTAGQNFLNSTNTFSVVGRSNAVVSPTYGKSSFIDAFQLSNDHDMPELEDIIYSDDDNDVGAEADFNNLETSITVRPIPTTRVYKDHHVS
nr:hypothetical protein [Tanacetum cinerariifolium]